ncbi:ATP-dependent DNA helicase RecG [Fusobacterium gastrosuis]|uniref:ATP-dependent DNA helicase RecG n=1 Tax=Fusobacterium gastrosuis TaxID=1755100 RepID=UPI0029729289|nr:ATP-dependent DNA helicase RecG [Fusobacteriaceae bacterium]MDY5713765.1 ATP-dependent DNA helicase RecG [Fusobacterium gastrosuis]
MLGNYQYLYHPLEKLGIKFITEKQLNNLKKLGINSIYDMLYYFPRAYDDRTNIKKIAELRTEEYVVVKANILTVSFAKTKVGKTAVTARITDGTGIMEVYWFGMPYLKKSLKIGEEYIFIGQVKKTSVFRFINPEYKLTSAQKKITTDEILPIYSSSKDINQNILRKLFEKFIKSFLENIEENIPISIIGKYNILNRKDAIREIHFPSSIKTIEESKRRFAIEELLILELGILKNRFLIESSNKKYDLSGKKNLVKNFLASLSFELTSAQKKVIKEIYDELAAGKIVNRLVQGDVGSGKTMVAMVMLIYMAENGYQGALMAPTEILANQHYIGVKDKFEKLGLKVEILTSSIKGKKKNKILEEIASGEIDIVIGTHALIEDNVIFNKLGLIVIDEQHRFGVNQRNKLREKGFLGNLLVMSATPIPRSLALSIYGDLDLSIIDKLPPGRSPIKTKWINNSADLGKMYDFILKKIDSGSQAYFVAPLIEESEKISLKSIEKLNEDVIKRFPNKKIAIIHGKMKSKEKDEIMLKFKNKQYQILIATTVIEVGIDVPSSTIMCIFNAERFGLSALHQLRGRVGRGSMQSYCFLVSESKTDNSIQRLSIMEETQDGFRIAEEDLKLRNSGEIFGLRQSGFSDLKFIDIIYDIKTIKLVRDECIKYLKENRGEIKNIYLAYDIEKKFENNSINN